MKTLKAVAEWARQPPHRFIHLCEQEVVKPAIDSEGRGTMRRFNRENVFRLLVGLHMQDMGLQVPAIKRLMTVLSEFAEMPEILELKKKIEDYDLVAVIKQLGDLEVPVMAFLTTSEDVHLYAPRLHIVPPLGPSVNRVVPSQEMWSGVVTVTVNLWMVASWLV